MLQYPRYTTTVIGSYSVPRRYEALDRLVTMGQLEPADMSDAQFRAMEAAVLEQESAGIDVITAIGCAQQPRAGCVGAPSILFSGNPEVSTTLIAGQRDRAVQAIS
jgi:hypothetical protein